MFIRHAADFCFEVSVTSHSGSLWVCQKPMSFCYSAARYSLKIATLIKKATI